MTQNHKWRKIKNDPKSKMTQNQKSPKIKNDPNFVELSRKSVESQKKFRREPAESIKVRRVSNKKMSQFKKCLTLKKVSNSKNISNSRNVSNSKNASNSKMFKI